MAVITADIVQTLGNKLPLLLPTIAVLLAVFLGQRLLQQNPLANVPVALEDLAGDEKRRQAYITHAKDVYLDGYKKFKDRVFRIITTNKYTVIVVPPKYLNEIKQLPDDVVSFDGAIEQTMHAKYTKLEVGHKLIPHVVKSNLTPSLVRLNPTIAEEVLESFRRELPECNDWTSVNINYKLLRIVALVSGRIFIGTELSRSDEYIDMAINYTVELMEARRAVDEIKPWLRPFLANRLPEVKKLDQRLKEADRLIKPVVAERRNRTENKPDDVMQWLLDGQAKYGAYTTETLARIQLGISFAAIHTTTLTSTNVFYNLAAYPQYLPILREEICNVLAEHKTYTSVALQSMKRLDSFIKETMRLDPAGATSMQRQVNKPFTLSNGQYIPAGVIIEIPAHAVSRDPEVFEDPEEFKPWRFYDMRQQAREAGEAEQAAQHQFVSVNPSVLTFGYGRHACPGRFFAANEIKMIVANVLLMYDIKLPEGQEGRYPNLEFGVSSVPDPTKELLFKRAVA
ncbi:putative cytochrome P450 E-class, group IV [Podospora australis]|uniref:Cytochrome P450 E-class, group IV n=1 Tax=Podospora australis TaxID=1536484 RepID=A0AAN7AD57_9PEZI|nr:putative cytochrome P450 E-class, group IV [Podospora australis]